MCAGERHDLCVCVRERGKERVFERESVCERERERDIYIICAGE